MSFLILQSFCDDQTMWHVRTFCASLVIWSVLDVTKLNMIRAPDTDFNKEAERKAHKRGMRCCK